MVLTSANADERAKPLLFTSLNTRLEETPTGFFQPALQSDDSGGLGIIAVNDFGKNAVICEERPVLSLNLNEFNDVDSATSFPAACRRGGAMLIKKSCCFAVGNDSSVEDEVKEQRLNIYPLLSRLRHCCNPNAAFRLVGGPQLSGLRLQLLAVNDISRGDEISVAFSKGLFGSAAFRTRLMGCSVCSCSRCAGAIADRGELIRFVECPLCRPRRVERRMFLQNKEQQQQQQFPTKSNNLWNAPEFHQLNVASAGCDTALLSHDSDPEDERLDDRLFSVFDRSLTTISEKSCEDEDIDRFEDYADLPVENNSFERDLVFNALSGDASLGPQFESLHQAQEPVSGVSYTPQQNSHFCTRDSASSPYLNSFAQTPQTLFDEKRFPDQQSTQPAPGEVLNYGGREMRPVNCRQKSDSGVDGAACESASAVLFLSLDERVYVCGSCQLRVSLEEAPISSESHFTTTFTSYLDRIKTIFQQTCPSAPFFPLDAMPTAEDLSAFKSTVSFTLGELHWLNAGSDFLLSLRYCLAWLNTHEGRDARAACDFAFKFFSYIEDFVSTAVVSDLLPWATVVMLLAVASGDLSSFHVLAERYLRSINLFLSSAAGVACGEAPRFLSSAAELLLSETIYRNTAEETSLSSSENAMLFSGERLEEVATRLLRHHMVELSIIGDILVEPSGKLSAVASAALDGRTETMNSSSVRNDGKQRQSICAHRLLQQLTHNGIFINDSNGVPTSEINDSINDSVTPRSIGKAICLASNSGTAKELRDDPANSVNSVCAPMVVVPRNAVAQAPNLEQLLGQEHRLFRIALEPRVLKKTRLHLGLVSPKLKFASYNRIQTIMVYQALQEIPSRPGDKARKKRKHQSTLKDADNSHKVIELEAKSKCSVQRSTLNSLSGGVVPHHSLRPEKLSEKQKGKRKRTDLRRVKDSKTSKNLPHHDDTVSKASNVFSKKQDHIPTPLNLTDQAIDEERSDLAKSLDVPKAALLNKASTSMTVAAPTVISAIVSPTVLMTAPAIQSREITKHIAERPDDADFRTRRLGLSPNNIELEQSSIKRFSEHRPAVSYQDTYELAPGATIRVSETPRMWELGKAGEYSTDQTIPHRVLSIVKSSFQDPETSFSLVDPPKSIWGGYKYSPQSVSYEGRQAVLSPPFTVPNTVSHRTSESLQRVQQRDGNFSMSSDPQPCYPAVYLKATHSGPLHSGFPTLNGLEGQLSDPTGRRNIPVFDRHKRLLLHQPFSSSPADCWASPRAGVTCISSKVISSTGAPQLETGTTTTLFAPQLPTGEKFTSQQFCTKPLSSTLPLNMQSCTREGPAFTSSCTRPAAPMEPRLGFATQLSGGLSQFPNATASSPTSRFTINHATRTDGTPHVPCLLTSNAPQGVVCPETELKTTIRQQLAATAPEVSMTSRMPVYIHDSRPLTARSYAMPNTPLDLVHRRSTAEDPSAPKLVNGFGTFDITRKQA